MSTESQAAASRANSLLSTGPKTQEGKAKMFANPLRHGLTSAHLIIPGEREDDFLDLLQTFTRGYAPIGYAETTRVQQIVEAHWRLLRLRRAENALLARLVNEVLEEAEGNHDLALALVHERHHGHVGRFHRYETALTRQIHKAEKELSRYQDRRFEDSAVKTLNERAGSVSQNEDDLTADDESLCKAGVLEPTGPQIDAGSASQNSPSRTMSRSERRRLRQEKGKKAVEAALKNLNEAT